MSSSVARLTLAIVLILSADNNNIWQTGGSIILLALLPRRPISLIRLSIVLFFIIWYSFFLIPCMPVFFTFCSLRYFLFSFIILFSTSFRNAQLISLRYMLDLNVLLLCHILA